MTDEQFSALTVQLDTLIWLATALVFVSSVRWGHSVFEVVRYALRSKRFLSVVVVLGCGGEAWAQPVITGISPSSPGPGDTVTVTGGGFGASAYYIQFCYGAGFYNGDYETIVSWADGKIVCTLANNAQYVGNGEVNVWNAAGGEGSKTFTYGTGQQQSNVGTGSGQPPVVNGITSTSGVAGDSITVGGLYFGSTQGQGVIQFTGPGGVGVVNATINSWSEESISFVVPSYSWPVPSNVSILVVNNNNVGAASPIQFNWGTAGTGGQANGVQGDPLGSQYGSNQNLPSSTCGSCFGIKGLAGGYYGTGGNLQEVTTYFADFPCPLPTDSGGGTGACQVAMYANEAAFSASVPVQSVTFVWNPVFGGMSTTLGDYIWANPACNGQWQVVWHSGGTADIGPLTDSPGSCLAAYYGSSGGGGAGKYTVNATADCPPQGGSGSGSAPIAWGNFTNPVAGVLGVDPTASEVSVSSAAAGSTAWLGGWSSLSKTFANEDIPFEFPGLGTVPIAFTNDEAYYSTLGGAGAAAVGFRTLFRTLMQLWFFWGFFKRSLRVFADWN